MTPQEFITKWKRANLSERSACQQHFLDLCDVLGHKKPAAIDPDGYFFTFEKGAAKSDGGDGWADIWFRDHFAWEYKGKRKNLTDAYKQLQQYRESLENPPLLIVCDLDRFEIHTNFTRTAKRVFAFDLDGLAQPENLDVLRKAFTDPDSLRPGISTDNVTAQAAETFGKLADGMRMRGVPAEDAAHFLMKLMFCMFAEDINLLRDKLFSRLISKSKNDPARLSKQLAGLFEAMTTGGDFGSDEILHFNGGLFADAEVIDLTVSEIEDLIRVNDHDWASVEPSIFGTLFERTLDPAKRSQIGAHYTSREDMLTLLEPVVMTPLRREWEGVKTKCDKLTAEIPKTKTPATKKKKVTQRDKVLRDFVEHLAHIRVLDPACGSGNFLYMAINLLLDLEKEVITYASNIDISLLPAVRPTQLYGIEINPYAQQLAQVVIWIGYLQWMHHNGFNPPRNPVLEPIESIRRMDAILDFSDPDNPKEPHWPEADFIVGNPPFLGDKLMRGGLGDDYVDNLRKHYSGRVPGGADLCLYWFEKARQSINNGSAGRAGLLATQGIRGGANREVIKTIKSTGNIFFAESDRNWVLAGASVHVSMIGFDNGSETNRILDGIEVSDITSALTAENDHAEAKTLNGNGSLSFIGTTKGGSFDITEADVFPLFESAGNPNRQPNSDVLKPIVNGLDILRRMPQRWLIDNEERTEELASMYEVPHRLVVERVKPSRDKNRNKWLKENWWKLQRIRSEMRSKLVDLPRFIATPRVAKHRVFVWFEWPTITDDQTVVFASSENYFFGFLHSRVHEVWALTLCTRLETRPRYTPTTCFETFPFPEPTDEQRTAIGDAAAELDRLRNEWLNPAEWTRTEVLEFPGSVDGPWARFVHEPNERGIGTVRYPRTVPRDEDCEKKLKKRTLTNLYNARPTWLAMAHQKLDHAVCAAYGWSPDLSDDEIIANLLKLNLARAALEGGSAR